MLKTNEKLNQVVTLIMDKYKPPYWTTGPLSYKDKMTMRHFSIPGYFGVHVNPFTE